MNIIKCKINFKKGTCTTSGIDLIQGDYNSTKIVFTFDDDTGTNIFEMCNPKGELVYLKEIENNEIPLYRLTEDDEITTIFDTKGSYKFEVAKYDGDSKLTSAYGSIPVKKEQVVVDGEPVEAYLPIFDELLGRVSTALEEMDNVSIEAEKEDGVTTVTITGKDGIPHETEILDGEKGDTGPQGPAGTIEYADSDTLGGIKIRLSGTTLYIRNDGQDA